MPRMSKNERAECEKNLAVCRAAVATFEKLLKDDDAEASKCVAAADRRTVEGILQRDGARAAIQAIRELGGNSIADSVFGREREE